MLSMMLFINKDSQSCTTQLLLQALTDEVSRHPPIMLSVLTGFVELLNIFGDFFGLSHHFLLGREFLVQVDGQ
jgi:hypothetical protein